MFNKLISSLMIAGVLLGATNVYAEQTQLSSTNYVTTQEVQSNLTPAQVLQRLKAGNVRFMSGNLLNRDWAQQVARTAQGQHPAAVILNCMDSRNIPELVFDQGIGDIFAIRVAGNVVNPDVLGSMEYATKIVGAKLIVVLGHTSCGAVVGACKGAQLGNLTGLLQKIQPAVKQAETKLATVDCNNKVLIDEIAKDNVLNMMQQIEDQSPVISKLIAEKKVGIIGGMYDVNSGKVTFFEDSELMPASK